MNYQKNELPQNMAISTAGETPIPAKPHQAPRAFEELERTMSRLVESADFIQNDLIAMRDRVLGEPTTEKGANGKEAIDWPDSALGRFTGLLASLRIRLQHINDLKDELGSAI